MSEIITFPNRHLNVGTREIGKWLYKIEADSISRIVAVRDGGMALELDGDDFATVLRIRSIAPGHARSCVSKGIIRLGADPAFPVTVDCIGIGAKPRTLKFTDLAGAVRCGDYHADWLAQVEEEGLIERQ